MGPPTIVPAAILLTVALATAWSSPAMAQTPAGEAGAELAVALSPEEITVGDRVTAILTLTVPAAELQAEPSFPVWDAGWGEAEIFEAGEAHRIAEIEGVVTYRQRLVIAAFRPGEIELPKATVVVPLRDGPLQIQTPEELKLTLISVLPEGEDPEGLEARPPAPPRALAAGAAFWWTSAAMGALALALALLLWRRRQSAGAASRPILAPFTELQRALSVLATAGLTPAISHEHLSLALRRYLGRSLGFHAAESTTSEIHRQLLIRHLPADLAPGVRQVLRDCDLVKFARRPTESREVETRSSLVRGLAAELESHLYPPVLSPDQPPPQTLGRGGSIGPKDLR